MNLEEFNVLIERAENLTTLPNWLATKNPIETLAAWYRLIERVEIDAALRVLDKIVTGEIELPRDSWSAFPKVLLRETKRQAKTNERKGSGAPTDRVKCRRCGRRFRVAPLARLCPKCKVDDFDFEIDCPDCGDLGVVVVWSPRAINEARRMIVTDKVVDLRPAGPNVCGVACRCRPAIGRRHFDSSWMVPVEPTATAVARLIEQVEINLYGRAGRRDDFAAFNAGGKSDA